MIASRLVPSLALIGLLGAFPGPAQAGFFDSLFGAAPLFRPMPQPYTGDPERPLDMPEAPSVRHRHVVATPKPTAAQIAAIKATTIMTDKTLRDGDAVMTANGIRIFRGQAGSRHTAADFVPLGQDAAMSKVERTELVAMNAHRVAEDDWQESGEAPVITGRSASAPPRVRSAKGPDGETIRRVGP